MACRTPVSAVSRSGLLDQECPLAGSCQVAVSGRLGRVAGHTVALGVAAASPPKPALRGPGLKVRPGSNPRVARRGRSLRQADPASELARPAAAGLKAHPSPGP